MLTNLFLSLGLTRDSWAWFWGRLTSASLLIVSGVVPLDGYVTPGWKRVIVVAGVAILWLSGKFDSSTLPPAKRL